MPSSDQSTINHSLFTAAFPNQFLYPPKQGEGCREQRMEETEFRGRHSRLKQHHLSTNHPYSASLPPLFMKHLHLPLPSTQCANTLLAFQLWLMLFLSFERPSRVLSAHRQTRLPSGTTVSHGISFLTPIQPGLSFL